MAGSCGGASRDELCFAFVSGSRCTPESAERLVEVVQRLSLARDLGAVMAIVRCAARELTGADGATFVLREGGFCYYADEDAIAPLWKGHRFPLEACISGWVMSHGETAAIEDVYTDPRIPIEAYEPTFVRSLAMVPIRTAAPIGAIGNYWAKTHRATAEEVAVLQALADSTSVAMENVQVYGELERRVRERTAELEEANRTLVAQHDALRELQRQKDELSLLLMHDVSSPAGGILLAAEVQLRRPHLSDAERQRWSSILSGAQAIQRTARNLLDIARAEEKGMPLRFEATDVRRLLEEVRLQMLALAGGRRQRIEVCADVPDGQTIVADGGVLRRILQNVVENALIHGPPGGVVEVRVRPGDADSLEFVVRDEGPGVPPDQRQQIFGKYVRLGTGRDDRIREGRGLGLAFARLAAEAHAGAIWVDDAEPRGARFHVRIPREPRAAGAARDGGALRSYVELPVGEKPHPASGAMTERIPAQVSAPRRP